MHKTPSEILEQIFEMNPKLKINRGRMYNMDKDRYCVFGLIARARGMHRADMFKEYAHITYLPEFYGRRGLNAIGQRVAGINDDTGKSRERIERIINLLKTEGL